jgi:hypothetical protein
MLNDSSASSKQDKLTKYGGQAKNYPAMNREWSEEQRIDHFMTHQRLLRRQKDKLVAQGIEPPSP